MPMCPSCNTPILDGASVCSRCGLLFTDDPQFDQTALDALLHNCRIMAAQLSGDSFQQMLGPFGPRVGYGIEDGIGFTETTARIVSQHLREHGVLCMWLALTANYHTEHSLMIAGSERGLARGVRAARKIAHQMRGRLEVRSSLSQSKEMLLIR